VRLPPAATRATLYRSCVCSWAHSPQDELRRRFIIGPLTMEDRPSSAIGARLTTLRCRAKQRQQRGGKCGLGCQIPLIGSGPGAGWQIIRRQPSG
jgi:hypothetical protein